MILDVVRSDPRFAIGAVLAAAAGIGIALVDSRPGFDDTGVTVFALLIAAAVTAAVAGRRPWLMALLVGGFVPLVEIVGQGTDAAPLVALLFAGVGAFVGSMLGQVFEQSR